MIYKQKTNLQATEHFLEDFLKERRIENLQTFLHPTAQEQHDFMLLDNIVSAAKCLIEHVENNDNIFIQIDSDTDGYTSAAIMYLYIKHT